jgi:hypothetical protein
LALIADKLVANPKMKRCAAMNEVKNSRKDWGVSDKTLLQRWRDKWSKQEPQLMEAARKRAERKATPSSSGNGYAVAGYGGFSRLGLVQAEYERMTRVQELMRLATMSAVDVAGATWRWHQQLERSMQWYGETDKMVQVLREQERIREIVRMQDLTNPYRF